MFLLLSCGSFILSADSIPDDFEWKVPSLVLDNEYDQVVKGVYKDIQSETVYTILQNYDAFTGNPNLDEYVVVNRFNTTTHEYDSSFIRDFPGNNNDYIVHGGRWYVFHVSDGFLHIRLNNSSIDTMKWEYKYYDYTGYRLIGVYDGALFFLMFSGEYGHTVKLFSVNITTFAWTSEVIFQFNDQGSDSGLRLHHIFKNGTLYLARAILVGLPEYYEIWLHEYDIDSGHSESPRLMWSIDNLPFGPYDFDIDSEGNFHLLIGGPIGRLNKLTPSMELEDWIELEVSPGDTRVSRGTLFIIIDGSDTIQVLGSLFYNTTENWLLTSWTLYSNYSLDMVRKTIFEGRTPTSSIKEEGIICNSNGEIIVCFRTLNNDKYMTTYSCMIPPSPDLSLSPEDFRLFEQLGTQDPVVITIRIENIGRAVAERYSIRFLTRSINETVFSLVGRIECNESLSRGMDRSHKIALRLPHGGLTLLVLIHGVVPIENYIDNNAVEVYVFINVNHPPATSVFNPENGTVVDDFLTIEGRTEDIDTDDEIVNIIEGLPSQTFQVLGSGIWHHTINLENVPSGDYLLSIKAYDGNDYSPTIFRSIRVDHPEETLLISSYEPTGAQSLFVSEHAEFIIYVSDYFSRNLEYSWYLNNKSVGLSHPFYLFESQVPGKFMLRVEVTNIHTIVFHEWALSVREPVEPTVISKAPLEDIVRTHRAQQIDFSINISNPDGLSLAIVWRIGNKDLLLEDATLCTLSFETKGLWTVTAIVHSTNIYRIVTWSVIVENTPPRILSTNPEPSIIRLEGDMVSFSVEAYDQDGDNLSYKWSAVNYTVTSTNSSTLNIVFQGIANREITISVEVSDGAHGNATSWKVVVKGEETADNDDPNLAFYIAITIITVAILSIVFYFRRRVRGSG